MVLSNESRERYQALLARLIEDFEPASDPEFFPVEGMAMAWLAPAPLPSALKPARIPSTQPFDHASHDPIVFIHVSLTGNQIVTAELQKLAEAIRPDLAERITAAGQLR